MLGDTTKYPGAVTPPPFETISVVRKGMSAEPSRRDTRIVGAK